MCPDEGVASPRKRGEITMNQLKHIFSSLVCDESGPALIEYALVGALIGLGAVASMKALASTIGNAFNTFGNNLTSNV
jgi:pilus assembly protein Flp/PilA